jgi:hypothetical protein
MTTPEIAGYAAVYQPRPADRAPMCFAWGETLDVCKWRAQHQLQVPHNQAGCRLYGDLRWVPLTADEASEIAEMLDAEWIFD